MVFKIYAVDLDLSDRRRTRRQLHSRLDSQIHCRQILPATSVNKLSNFGGRWHSEATTSALDRVFANRSFKFAISISKAPLSLRSDGALQKKENQCQES